VTALTDQLRDRAGDLPEMCARPLVPLPPQPVGVPWPTEAWPTADPDPAVAGRLVALLDDLTGDVDRYGTTYAVAVAHRGVLVAERYGGVLEHWDRPFEPVEPTTRLMSWSMAKSILHAVVGTLVGEGRLALEGPAPVPEWSDPADPRHAITLDDLLEMRDGLAFSEDYADAGVSDVIEMLFGAGEADMAHFAADRPLAHPPGTVFNYSSGTSNIVSGIVARQVGPGAPYEALLRERLFGPLGMRSATPAFDAAGTFVGSSSVHATAQDFLRFGLLYLRDGVWEGRLGRSRAAHPVVRPAGGPVVRRPLVERRRRPRHVLGKRLRGPVDHDLPAARPARGAPRPLHRRRPQRDAGGVAGRAGRRVPGGLTRRLSSLTAPTRGERRQPTPAVA
jgi:CubicO group peptidase (beta-lactamase class C family)